MGGKRLRGGPSPPNMDAKTYKQLRQIGSSNVCPSHPHERDFAPLLSLLCVPASFHSAQHLFIILLLEEGKHNLLQEVAGN